MPWSCLDRVWAFVRTRGNVRYTSFEFKNFKGIREARVDLAPEGSEARIYTLVGLNESGKTTILEGIDLFKPVTDDELEVSPKQLAGWTALIRMSSSR